MTSLPIRVRAVSLLGLLAGAAHLLVPDRLLASAQWSYDRFLAVDFEPRSAATLRVRLVGLSMVGASVLAWRLSRVIDDGETE